jgi:hypothetical protein
MNVTRGYLNSLKPQLTERDRDIIARLGQFKLMTGTQVERLFFHACSATSRARNRQAVLKRLTDHRVLARLDRRVGGPSGGSADYVYTLDVAGQRLAETSERPRRPYVWYDPTIQHYLAVSEVFVRLMEAQHSGSLTVLRFEAEPYCWRNFAGQTLKPDAFVQVGVLPNDEPRKRTRFLEVDRGTQYGAKIASKLPAYEQYWRHEHNQGRRIPRVIFLASTAERRDYLAQLVAGAPPLFEVVMFDEVIAALAGSLASLPDEHPSSHDPSKQPKRF